MSVVFIGVPYTPLHGPSHDPPHDTQDDFFASGNAPKHACLEWFLSLFRCLCAPLGWLRCLCISLFQCLTWSCPTFDKWDIVVYLLRFTAYAVTAAKLRDGTLQATIDLTTIVDPVLAKWLGKGVSRCAVSTTVNPTETLGGRGEWLWPTGTGLNNDTSPPTPSTAPKVVLYLHGGAFVLCNAATHRVITYELCRRTGLPVVVSNARQRSAPPPNVYRERLTLATASSRHALTNRPRRFRCTSGRRTPSSQSPSSR